MRVDIIAECMRKYHLTYEEATFYCENRDAFDLAFAFEFVHLTAQDLDAMQKQLEKLTEASYVWRD